MANRSQNTAPQDCSVSPGAPSPPSEPEIRRWPHPVAPVRAAVPSDAALHYIQCALSYQNQLLADIKTLLEKISQDLLSERAEK